MPRRRNNMQHVKMKNSPCSPDAGTPRLRPRNSITSNYIQHFDDLEEELKLEDMIPIRELRSSARQSSIQVNMGDVSTRFFFYYYFNKTYVFILYTDCNLSTNNINSLYPFV